MGGGQEAETLDLGCSPTETPPHTSGGSFTTLKDATYNILN